MAYAIQQLRIASEVLDPLSALEFTKMFLRLACCWEPTIIMSVFSVTWTSAFEAIFSSPDSPFEDIHSLPEYSPADSRQWKLYINLVTSDGVEFLS